MRGMMPCILPSPRTPGQIERESKVIGQLVNESNGWINFPSKEQPKLIYLPLCEFYQRRFDRTQRSCRCNHRARPWRSFLQLHRRLVLESRMDWILCHNSRIFPVKLRVVWLVIGLIPTDWTVCRLYDMIFTPYLNVNAIIVGGFDDVAVAISLL